MPTMPRRLVFRKIRFHVIANKLGGIRETLIVYPRRQGQRQAPTATCLTRMLTITRKRSFLDIRPEGGVIIRAAGANHLSDY